MAYLRQIALNGTGGAFVNILAATFTRSIEMQEDEAGAVQGLEIYSLEDNFLTLNTFSFDSEPLQIPNIHRMGDRGALLGMPAQGAVGAFNYRAADKLVSARSATATATVLRFIENP